LTTQPGSKEAKPNNLNRTKRLNQAMENNLDAPKPLSEKAAGYGLALLGGVLGGPLGLISSPLTLLILNRLRKSKDQDRPNRFLTWALLGIIGAPVSWLGFLTPLLMTPDDPEQGCIKVNSIKNTYSPYILYQSIPKCMAEGDTDSAAFLWSMINIYGYYDALRVEDQSASAAIGYLEMRLFQQDLDKASAKRLAEAVAAHIKNGPKEICNRLRSVGAPSYHPSYMIEHGINATTGEAGENNGLKPNYDGEANWKEVLTDYIKCPSE
jgi:hypothetical protein